MSGSGIMLLLWVGGYSSDISSLSFKSSGHPIFAFLVLSSTSDTVVFPQLTDFAMSLRDSPIWYFSLRIYLAFNISVFLIGSSSPKL